MSVEITMPTLSDDVDEGVVVTWFVEEGDAVEEGQALVEVQVEKVAEELEAPSGGRVDRILVPAGQVAAQGAPLCVLVSA